MAWLVPRSERSKQETRTHTHTHILMNWDKAVQPAAPRKKKRRGAKNLRSVSQQPLRVRRPCRAAFWRAALDFCEWIDQVQWNRSSK